MKKIALILLSITFLLTSCHKDLDIVQNNQLSANNMWKTEADVRSAVFGAYVYVRNSLKTNIMYWGEYRNGLWGPGTFGTLHDAHMSSTVSSTMNATNSYASWTNLYTTINQANLIIRAAQEMDISQEAKGFALSHGHFIRAYMYFLIGRTWGDAPLALEGFESTEQDMYLSRAPQAEVFAQVEADLATAQVHVSHMGSNKAIATAAALAMLQADFGLWMYRVQEAGDSYLAAAESAIATLALSPDRLETNFAKIFDPAAKKGKEIIWALHQEQGESEGGFMRPQLWNSSYILPAHRNTTVPIIENQWWVYTDAYIDLIQENASDQRSAVTYAHGPYGTGNQEVGWANKYVGRVISGTRVLDDDIVMYRYAQAYLLDAEIKYYRSNYSGALASVNVVANRAYGQANHYTDTAPAAVLQALVTENLKEFASEGNTWWTLIRTDKVWDYNPSVASQHNKTNILLWPITQSAINRNRNLTQTVGW